MTLFTAIKKWLHRMFGKTEEKTVQPVKTKKKLSRADKKQIEAAIARANRTDKKGKSAQDSIPYERMWPDGICRVSDSHYTKTIQFQDINYQLSQNEDKTAIFEGWCDFLNYFDSSIHFQLSFLNLAASEETFANSISIPPQRDAFDSIREEYTTMLQNQLARGNNGLIKTKYLTFGIDADSIKAAKPRLERIETDILNNFKRLGVAARTLDGKERLFQLHAVFHMDEQLPFQFEWDWLAPSGLSTKDFIAPSSFEFRTGKQFRMGKKYGTVSFLQILAPELNDRLLADFLDMESSLIVSMHIQSVDQVKAIKTVKRKITDLDRSKIEEQKKAVRAGYDMDIIPSDLATYGSEAKKLLQDLQSRNERMFLLTFLVLNTADNPRQLGNNIFQAGSIAQKYNCQLTRLDFQQEEGLMSCLPLGLNQIEIQRGLTTSSTAIFVPFTTQELFQNGKEALYYGINALSNNLIMVDRKLLKNPNGLILGTPGSGKSFSAKREIANCFLLTSDDVIICDPEAEYAPLVERLHGQVIKISPTSTNYINPMDLNLDYSDDESPLSLKSDFILSLCELIVGGILMAGVLFLITCMLMNTMSSCSMMAQSIGSVLSGTTYPSDDPEMLAVEADYAAREAQLQEEIDNIESSHPGYDEYRYDLGMIGHDPHELAAFLSAVLQGYTRQSAQAELARVFAAQYQLTLTEEVEIRYRTETSTDPETGETTSEEVPYEYYILNVKLTSKPISAVASELLTPEQMEMYQVYRQTMGNKPLLFGGGSPDMSNSEDLTGVQFVNGTRPGNPQLVELAKRQVGNVGGYPYWSWYGFDSRVEWCACFVSWCYNQAGKSEPRFAGCEWQGVPWFQSHGQWGARGYNNLAPGDAIFFDWDLDGTADHVGIVIGTDGSRVYTVEGNSGDACKIKSYDLNYQSIKGYGLMNW